MRDGPDAEHWRVAVWEAQEPQHAILGYLQLMQVFGPGVGATVRYVRAAHPEKFRRDPTSP